MSMPVRRAIRRPVPCPIRTRSFRPRSSTNEPGPPVPPAGSFPRKRETPFGPRALLKQSPRSRGDDSGETSTPVEVEVMATYKDPENTLVIETTKGSVVIEMRPDLAPGHVAQIKKLAREGQYDGVVFHR